MFGSVCEYCECQECPEFIGRDPPPRVVQDADEFELSLFWPSEK